MCYIHSSTSDKDMQNVVGPETTHAPASPSNLCPSSYEMISYNKFLKIYPEN